MDYMQIFITLVVTLVVVTILVAIISGAIYYFTGSRASQMTLAISGGIIFVLLLVTFGGSGIHASLL